MKHLSSLAVAVAVAVGCDAIVIGQSHVLDYTQWRGRDRDGSASGFVAPVVWPEKLTRKWKVDIGEGYATPLLVENAVYAFTRQGTEEVMSALSADSGTLLWRTSHPALYSPSHPTAAHGAGPKATPLFFEGRLFTLGINGVVTAFDTKSGRVLWRTPAPSEPPYFSAASSSVGDTGLVIAHPGNYGPLTAFDASTGRLKWTAGDDGFFASPIIANLDGVRQVVSATQTNVIGVSLPDGKLLWQYPFANNGGITPVVRGQTIIVSGLDVGVEALRPARQNGSWIVERLWATKDVSMYLSNPVMIGETLFGLSHRASGQFFALDAVTGRTLWLGTPREAMNTAVVKAGDLLFLLNDDAELIVAKSNRASLDVLKRYTVADSATWAQPAISGNRLFIKDVSTLALWTVQ